MTHPNSEKYKDGYPIWNYPYVTTQENSRNPVQIKDLAVIENFSEILKDINWNRVVLTVIPLLQPFILFGTWVMFARVNKKANVLSKFIAIAEAIPTLDLGIPKEVVLASLYDLCSLIPSFL